MKREQYLKELQIIAEQNNGILRAEDVVAFAKNPQTVLHSYFDWDDTIAAHKWRLQQARQLIRVMVTVLPSNNNVKYRIFVSMKDDRYNKNGGGYRPITVVLSQETMWAKYKDEIRQDMLIFIRRWEVLKEVEPVIREMKKLLNKIENENSDQLAGEEINKLGYAINDSHHKGEAQAFWADNAQPQI